MQRIEIIIKCPYYSSLSYIYLLLLEGQQPAAQSFS